MGERIMLEPTFGEEVDQVEAKPNMLIVTGPQGSGNHLFANLFNLHPEVLGHHTEPFSEMWWDTSKIKDFGWSLRSDFYTTSITCPYYQKWEESSFIENKEPQLPRYEEFITELEKYCNVVIAIIGRDRTILEREQIRTRDVHTTPAALEQFQYLYTLNPYFISMELAFLYRENYLRMIGLDLGFPIVDDPDIINDVLSNEPESNKNYIHEVDGQP